AGRRVDVRDRQAAVSAAGRARTLRAHLRTDGIHSTRLRDSGRRFGSAGGEVGQRERRAVRSVVAVSRAALEDNFATGRRIYRCVCAVAAGVSKHGLLAASGLVRTVLCGAWSLGGAERTTS